MEVTIAFRFIAFTLLLLAYPLSFILADWWSWEMARLR
jgi:hypothetical protein